MDEKRIQRINELYHKSVETGLTEKEKEEQKALRREYIDAVKGSLRSRLEQIAVADEDGVFHELQGRKGTAREQEGN